MEIIYKNDVWVFIFISGSKICNYGLDTVLSNGPIVEVFPFDDVDVVVMALLIIIILFFFLFCPSGLRWNGEPWIADCCGGMYLPGLWTNLLFVFIIDCTRTMKTVNMKSCILRSLCRNNFIYFEKVCLEKQTKLPCIRKYNTTNLSFLMYFSFKKMILAGTLIIMSGFTP